MEKGDEVRKEHSFRTRYTIDSKGRVRKYGGRDAWNLLRKTDERQVRLKDLPKGFTIYETWDDFDV